MSIEDLKADLESNMAACKALISPLTTPSELAAHLHNCLYPFISNVVNEIEEVDSAVETLFNESDDVLQPETAAVFAAVIAGGQVLVKELSGRLTPADDKLKQAIAEWLQLAAVAGSTLEDITLDPSDPDPDDDDDDEDDDDDDQPSLPEGK